jgi:hypothetical protein
VIGQGWVILGQNFLGFDDLHASSFTIGPGRLCSYSKGKDLLGDGLITKKVRALTGADLTWLVC